MVRFSVPGITSSFFFFLRLYSSHPFGLHTLTRTHAQILELSKRWKCLNRVFPVRLHPSLFLPPSLFPCPLAHLPLSLSSIFPLPSASKKSTAPTPPITITHLRLLTLLTHLSSHLSQSSQLPQTATGHWLTKRDDYAGGYLALKAELENGEREREREEWMRGVREVVEAVGRAVEVDMGVRW